MTQDEILTAVQAERARQRTKWNRQHVWGYGDCSRRLGYVMPSVTAYLDIQYSNLIKAAVLAEESGEVTKAALDIDEAQFYAEVVQVAAVAWAILEGKP